MTNAALDMGTLPTAYIAFILAILGACMGSFINCISWRIVHGESALRGRSHCDNCGHLLSFADLVPIVSYIIHKGKCRYCGVSISPKHIICEAVSAICFVFVFFKYNISLQVIEYLLFVSILLACSFADLEGHIIPDRFIVSGFVVRAVFIVLDWNIHTLVDSLIGAVAVFAALLAVVLVFEKLIGKEAMGGGDLKLIAMCGFFLGWKGNILCLLLSCLIGIAFGLISINCTKSPDGEDDVRSAQIPWGPSIALAAFVTMLTGEKIISAYLKLFNA